MKNLLLVEQLCNMRVTEDPLLVLQRYNASHQPIQRKKIRKTLTNHIIHQWKRLNKWTKDQGHPGVTNITEIYRENYKNMVKQTFRNEKGETDTKEMYARITALSEIKQITEFITPGESFIISNEQAKAVQKGDLEPDATQLLTDRDILLQEYHTFLE